MDPNFPPPPPAPPQKKGLSPLAWVGIGCGGLLILGIVVMALLIGMCAKKVNDMAKNPDKAAAEMIVRMNPDVEKVSSDDAKGEMTVRTKDGKTMTFSYADLKEGKLRVSDGEGGTFETGGSAPLPDWLPEVPGKKSTANSWSSTRNGKKSGMFSVTSSQSPEAVEKALEEAFKAAGFSRSSRSSANSAGNAVIILAYGNSGRKANIVIGGKPGADTSVSMTYEESP